ncbi:MAG: hypothetical protein LBR29_00565 [Methylobacteriaceae bacterium]|jgi:hypothetical protein|nr:hypothetical protein [Methylobacteriaceae bacterium]
MNTGEDNSKLQIRVSRDQRNAESAAFAAQRELDSFHGGPPPVNTLHGLTEHDRKRIDMNNRRRASLQAIADESFHAMAEVYAEVRGSDEPKLQLWYANSSASTNEPLKVVDGAINVLSWTHPGVQLALALDVGGFEDIKANGYSLRSIEVVAKARFDAVLPQISAVYQPGGAVRTKSSPPIKTGLKAVKLHMTPDQAHAFISRMSGLMIVTGAPGSGKTTVAFQRIRFLFDQQDQRDPGERLVPYTPQLTRIFLANNNLAVQAKSLLKNQLDIPDFIVESVGSFVDAYLEHVWLYKHNARPRQKKLSSLEAAARTAILGLSDNYDLVRFWEVFEHQISGRLSEASSADWLSISKTDRTIAARLSTLAEALSRAGDAAVGRDPLISKFTMNAVYSEVLRPYDAARQTMAPNVRDTFDEQFQQWLFWVYDPLSAVATYFGARETEAAQRMRLGTGSRVDEPEILRNAIAEWGVRGYGPEDRPWLAWLLRFALPEETDAQARFRGIPSAISPAMSSGERWTHIVIDEAQDLCAAEASLLGSLVDPDGALTVSADFHQIVSPVHGIRDIKALNVGRSLRGKKAEQIYPFARNMRQSQQIGRFLQGFYEAAFGERPTFGVNEGLQDTKPQLYIAPPHEHARRIKQIAAALRRSEVVNNLAVLQINENEQALAKLRSELQALGVPLAAIWAAAGEGVITTSVERIKGLEFDACIVLGLEEVEMAALNFTLNRAYVALSRPARRLALICSEYPTLLRNVRDKTLFDVFA